MKNIILYGKKSIAERLQTDPGSIKEAFVTDDFSDNNILTELIKHHIPTDRISEKKMRHVVPAKNVQGIAAKANPFEYTPYNKLLDLCKKGGRTLVFLDGINDPHNLGVILRTLACFGNFAVVIPEKGACEVNSTVVHVAVGGENYSLVARVENLHSSILEAKKDGIYITGSTIDTNTESIYDLKIKQPAGIVFGSEHKGIGPDILGVLDEKIHIPTPGAGLSLNITTACAIVCSYINISAKS